jgi:hypothetical protein
MAPSKHRQQQFLYHNAVYCTCFRTSTGPARANEQRHLRENAVNSLEHHGGRHPLLHACSHAWQPCGRKQRGIKHCNNQHSMS